MLTEWEGTTPGDEATGSRYFNDNLENGSLEKNAWVWSEPSEDWDIYKTDSDEHWFRTDNKGKIISDQTKKINSKWYVFDEWGIMQYGLVELDQNKVSGAKLVRAFDEDNTEASDIYATDGNLFYFSNNEESDGAMKTGSSITISLADDDYVFGFEKTSGEALCGIDNNKVYRNGIRQEADDDKYAIVLGGKGTDVKEYLVNSTGTRMKVNKYYKNDNDEYYVVIDGKDSTGFTIFPGADANGEPIYEPITNSKLASALAKADVTTLEEAEDFIEEWLADKDNVDEER